MKKSLFLIVLFISFFITSCSGDDQQISPINGTWYTFEQSVNLSSVTNSTDAAYLQERINVYYANEVKLYNIKKLYNNDILKISTYLKSDPDNLVSETSSSYVIKDDSITVNDMIYGSVKYKYIITDNVLVLYGSLNAKKVTDIATHLGMMNSIPSDITGSIKIKDYR